MNNAAKLDTERGRKRQQANIERSRRYLEARLHPLIFTGGKNFSFVSRNELADLKLWPGKKVQE